MAQKAKTMKARERIAVYYRVSTDAQDLGMQKREVGQWLKSRPGKNPVVLEYEDFAASGKSAMRKSYQRLIADARAKRFDTLAVYRLDRLTRDAATAIRLVLDLDDLGITFHAVGQPIFAENMPFRKTILTVFAELAQMEREMIVERVRAGLAAARERGVKFGAPIKVTPELRDAVKLLRETGMSFKKIASATGLGVGSVHRLATNVDYQPWEHQS